jgi:hypothetical protein
LSHTMSDLVVPPIRGPKYGVKGSNPASNRLTMTIATEVDEISVYQGGPNSPKAEAYCRSLSDSASSGENFSILVEIGGMWGVGAVYVFALCQVAKLPRSEGCADESCPFLGFCARVSSQGPVCHDRRKVPTTTRWIVGLSLQLNQRQHNRRFQPRDLSVQPPV